LSPRHETALVTGAGSGMGRSIAVSLAEMGIRVALIGRERSKLEATRDLLGAQAASALVEPCDVADREQVRSAVDRALKAMGSIDVLVCNAGVNTARRALDVLEPAEWDRLIATNLTGAYNLAHFVLPSMRERGRGLVVQICSVSGIRASVLGGTAYSASKFGQAALGICIGREERLRGVKSSVIYPGEVETPILDARPVPVSKERRSVILQPEDVAAAVRFLVELPQRAHIPEMVIHPTVDDFC
jgi:NADP-dependent 3-hydroxy acid dehydrogenase YdfG